MHTREKKRNNNKPEPFHVDEAELQALAERVAQRSIADGDWEKTFVPGPDVIINT